jgi:hypothetical protein
MRVLRILTALPLILALFSGSALHAQSGDMEVDDIVAEMTEALDLSEEQTTEVTHHLQQLAVDMDAATAKAEDEEPDTQQMIGDVKFARETYQKSMQETLTEEQWTAYTAMMDQIFQEIAESIAELRITDLRAPLSLTDDQAEALKPVMGTAVRGVVATIFEYGDKRMGVRTKLAMANKLKKIQADMQAGMNGILTPEQMQQYEAWKEAQKSESG